MTLKTILITGANSGFGKAVATAALHAGHQVIGTVRQEANRQEFESLAPGRAKSYILDVSDFEAVESTVKEIEKSWGPIDVLINNAGYGHEGILEESPLRELQRQFEVNVFGAVAMIKAVLPAMRLRRSGQIINITSMGGFITMPGIAYYCGSKFALEGISDTLGKEVALFGIKVTAVAPGSFRTDWAGRSMVRSERAIADYDELFDPIRQARLDKSGKQNGDPAKLAQVVLRLTEMDRPPAHLLLGSDALNLVRNRLTEFTEEIKRWEDATLSTDLSVH